MISYLVYKVLHLIGIFMIFMALGGFTLHMANGGSKESLLARRLAGITHGIGLLIVLVAGFGLMARLAIAFPWPGWLWIKIVVWVLLGGATAIIYRRPDLSRVIWVSILALGALNGYLAIMKPF
ncbi:MAG: hypothetical protein AAF702_49285 [Chloroflexota bacterium]